MPLKEKARLKAISLCARLGFLLMVKKKRGADAARPTSKEVISKRTVHECCPFSLVYICIQYARRRQHSRTRNFCGARARKGLHSDFSRKKEIERDTFLAGKSKGEVRWLLYTVLVKQMRLFRMIKGTFCLPPSFQFFFSYLVWSFFLSRRSSITAYSFSYLYLPPSCVERISLWCRRRWKSKRSCLNTVVCIRCEK